MPSMSASDERVISKDTPVTIGLVLAIAAALGWAAVDHYRVNLVQEAQAQADVKAQKATELENTVHLQTELRLQRIEDHWSDISASMKSLQNSVDDLRGTRNAKGHQ